MKDFELAYLYAPVILQKVNKDNPRADFITRVDFTVDRDKQPPDLSTLKANWSAVNAPMDEETWKKIDKDNPPQFEHEILPYVYYSVVETHTHYFIMYSIYHPQDWERPDAAWNKGPKWKPLEHEHDMEGVLVVVNKESIFPEPCCEAMLTISHDNFYAYANWRVRNKKNKEIPVFDIKLDRYTGSRVNREDLDGFLWAIFHIDEDKKIFIRPKVYIQAKGHGIRGDKSHWGGGDRIIRYCPSKKGSDEPSFFPNNNANPHAKLIHKEKRSDPNVGDQVKDEKEVYRYQLIDIFEPNEDGAPLRGLWASRNKTEVFMVDDRGQDCFIARESEKSDIYVPGSAKPPWSWDDNTDIHTSGELALQPAHITYNYLGGIREFSFEYIRNPYCGK